jgi:transcriptional regulator with XRE-family HTH domain
MYRFHPFHQQPLPQSIVAGWLHVSQATLSRIEHGRRHVTIDEVDSFTRALGMPVSLRWVSQHQAGEDVDPLSRRSLLGAGAGAALGLGATTAPAAAREIDPELVSHWTKLRKLLARHDAMFGPHDVLGAVGHELDLIAGHRKVARGDLRTDLLRVESRWAEFASWLSNDAGDWRRRDAWADRALRLAREADYSDVVAWILLWRSRWATEQHDARHAITFAQAAGRTAGISNRIRALCALKEAHGHALAGDDLACERSLADAHGRLDRDTADDDPWDGVGRRNVTRPYVVADEARCWLWLRPRKAIVIFEEASRLWPHDCTSHRGVHQARLALACAVAGEPDRAAAEGIAALEIAQTTRSHLNVRELKRLDHQLAACDLAGTADLREAIAAL